MTTTATTTTTTHPVRRNAVHPVRRKIPSITASAIVVVGLAIVWAGGRSGSPVATDYHIDPAAVTAGLSQELLAEELTAIRGAQVSRSGVAPAPVESGLTQELLAEELIAIRGAHVPQSGSRTPPDDSGLSQELLGAELTAIRAK